MHERSIHPFKSPETGKEYFSENPIDETTKKNTIFIERLGKLGDIPHCARIREICLDAGTDEFFAFQKMMEAEDISLDTFSSLQRMPPDERAEAVRYVASFFQAHNPTVRKSIMRDLAKQLKSKPE